MITLYVSGPNFGLPDPSPFVSKAEILLKMAGVPYETQKADFGKAPKGKIPYFDVDGERFGDSTFLRLYLEKTHGIDFDEGLSEQDRAIAWSVEKMAEEHLYWTVVHTRWANQENFDKGPRVFFDDVPFPMRPLVVWMVRRSVAKSMYGHGMGRHTQAEIEQLAYRDLDAIAKILADKPWLMGQTPCGADASIWSFVAGTLCPLFDTPIRTAAEKYPNLIAYADRGFKHWWPELHTQKST